LIEAIPAATMHHMTFWWDTNLGDVFFKGFAITTTGQMVGFCIALAALSILYEGLKVSSVLALFRL
jgi:Ctr copper transporter family